MPSARQGDSGVAFCCMQTGGIPGDHAHWVLVALTPLNMLLAAQEGGRIKLLSASSGDVCICEASRVLLPLM